MSLSIKSRVAELNLTLPEPAKAVGNYVPRLRIGDMLYISGQLPVLEGKPQYQGKVSVMEDKRIIADRREGSETAYHPHRSREDRRQDNDNCFGNIAVEAAQLCALNIIAQIAAEVDDNLEKVAHIVRLGGFVNASASFSEHAKIINGASDLMVAVFGSEVGTHVRAATGASSLPFGVPVEIEALVALK